MTTSTLGLWFSGHEPATKDDLARVVRAVESQFELRRAEDRAQRASEALHRSTRRYNVTFAVVIVLSWLVIIASTAISLAAGP